VGGTGVMKVDVRVIAATNRDPETLIGAGAFREDLFYRISTVIVRVPSLRQRSADVPALARHFAAAVCRRNHWPARRLSASALDLLAQQPWKGNVRELKNVVERALILSEVEELSVDDLRVALPFSATTAAPSSATARAPAPPAPSDVPLREVLDDYEREVIRERLRRFGGHVTNAAKSLGLERSHLYKKCRQLGVEIRDEG